MQLVSREKVTKGTLGGKPFLYNPASFQDSISVNYNEVQTCGMSYPALVYGGGAQRSINFDIYLNDKVEPGITRSFISHLHSYIPPAKKTGYQFKAPKKIVFSFGWFVKECYVQSMEIDYSAFSPQLQPIEATVNITLLLVQ